MRGLEDDHLAMDLLVRGFEISRVIRLVADLRIADRILPEAGANVTELASATGVLPEQLLRVIRVLAAFGIFRIDSDGTVSHTRRSLLLRTDQPNSLYHGARFWTNTGSWRAWERLDAALYGRVPHEAAWGISRYDYLRNTPDEARTFDSFMANYPDNRHSAVAAAYDFSKASLIVDIGGGNGETLRRILALYPALRGILFDRPDVIAAIPPAGLAGGRITTQVGSFFDGLPTDADLYLLVRVLHNWADEDASRILRSCRIAMRTGARLLVVEALINPDPLRGQQRNT